MKVKIKKLVPEAIIPSRAHNSDAGMDLYCTGAELDSHGNLVCHTGIAIEIPEGYTGLIFPRSSISKKRLVLSNCVGVIDSGYRGEIILKFKPIIDYNSPSNFNPIGKNGYFNPYKTMDKIGQLIIMPYPHVEFEEVKELSNTSRGEGGFGSTDSLEKIPRKEIITALNPNIEEISESVFIDLNNNVVFLDVTDIAEYLFKYFGDGLELFEVSDNFSWESLITEIEQVEKAKNNGRKIFVIKEIETWQGSK